MNTNDTKKYIKLFDLTDQFTKKELKDAYRDLAQIWHPDKHHAENTKLKKKAENKFKEINEGYEYLKELLEKNENNKYSKEYSEENFWEKLRTYAVTAGREVVEKALFLYYAYLEPETPAWAKATIIGALGYFISPIDAIPDIIPVVGYADDLGVLVMAVGTVAAYITPKVKKKAKKKIKDWFA